MTVKARGNSWQVSVGSGADRFRATAASKEEAELIERQELVKRKQKSLGILIESTAKPKVDVTLRKLLTLALRRKWANDSGVQAKNAELILQDLGEHTSVQDVNRDTLHEYVETLFDRGNSGATINRKLSAISVLLSIAEDEGWIERAPKLPRQSESKHRIRFFNNEEEDEMLRICEKFGMDDLADFIIFAIETGFRRMEILNLSVRDCENGNAVLHAGETKSGLARSVPLTTRAQSVVDKRVARGYSKLFEDLTDAQLRRRWDLLKDNMKDAGDHFLVHTLRHTCASRLAIEGQNATFIQTWMGHSSILVTQRYMHLAPDTLKQGAEALSNYKSKKQNHLKRVA